MLIRLMLLSFLALNPDATFAQRIARHTIYAEAKGPGGNYSFNYERIWPLRTDRIVLLGASVGYSYLDYDRVSIEARGHIFPLRLNLCAGWQYYYMEFGGDFVFFRYKDKDNSSFDPVGGNGFFLHAGLRFQSKHSGLFARAFIMPVKVSNGNRDFLDFYGRHKPEILAYQGKSYLWWYGVDLGWSF
ncbi:MAG: hypothetical protein SFV22_09260 [Saprospiraceae bacterium]|nr:hypothetical protein [Saprospiraceae bacterium]